MIGVAHDQFCVPPILLLTPSSLSSFSVALSLSSLLFPPLPLPPSSQAQKKLQEEELSHLRQLKNLGVDLTAYLVSQHPKPDQVLRVITLGTGGNVHIHP